MKHDPSTPTPTIPLAERIRATNEAMCAYREAKRRGAPIPQLLRLLEAWRKALEQLRD